MRLTLSWSVVPWLTPIAGVLNIVLLAAVYIGIAVSGNVHQPSTLVTVFALFAIYMIFVNVGAGILGIARRVMSKGARL
jgi:hypothetical protein